jgi:hypothetical protein
MKTTPCLQIKMEHIWFMVSLVQCLFCDNTALHYYEVMRPAGIQQTRSLELMTNGKFMSILEVAPFLNTRLVLFLPPEPWQDKSGDNSMTADRKH